MKRISWKKKINPCWWLKNDDDPVPPDDFHSKRPMWLRQLLWFVRNPMHNFTFYVIGIADRHKLRIGYHPTTVFINRGWNLCIVYVNKSELKIKTQGRHEICRYAVKAVRTGRVPLPFVSYQGNGLQFYVGWRERGNFGIKIRRRV